MRPLRLSSIPKAIPICLFLMAACSGYAYELQNGLAIVTSREGDVTLRAEGEGPQKASLHQTLELSSLKIVTDEDERLFLSLSNGMALGIDENTEILVEHFKQRPFAPKRESHDYEPSDSKLTLVLERGSIAVAANHLSPLSQITVRLPKGELRIHSSSCHIKYDETGTHISATEGDVTYQYPEDQGREFISNPQFIRVSDQSAMRGEIAERSDINIAMDPWRRAMLEASKHASRRVIYKLSDDSVGIPQPVLVAKPEVLSQPSPRPYQYLD